MGSIEKEVAQEVFPYIRVFKDGTFERLAGTAICPAGLDPHTGVESKDIMITPETGVSARIYRPSRLPGDRKLPVVVYFHGGAFIIASIAEPLYHNSLNQTVAAANVVLLSIDYRRVPEHPLQVAYDDSRAALRWVASHAGGGTEPWLRENVDFGRVFMAGDSAGANIAHHMAAGVGFSNPVEGLKVRGVLMINPYFWGKDPIGPEVSDQRKALVDSWWEFVCRSDKGCDDPLINPFAEGSPNLSGLACNRVLVCVAEKDILKGRGKLYYEKLMKSGWPGKAGLMETEGEDHVFHLFNPNCENAQKLIKHMASFINQA